MTSEYGSWRRLDIVPVGFGICFLLIFFLLFFFLKGSLLFGGYIDVDIIIIYFLLVLFLGLTLNSFVSFIIHFHYQEFILYHEPISKAEEREMLNEVVKGFNVIDHGPKSNILSSNYEGRLKIGFKEKGETINLNYFHSPKSNELEVTIHLGPISSRNKHLTRTLKKRLARLDSINRGTSEFRIQKRLRSKSQKVIEKEITEHTTTDKKAGRCTLAPDESYTLLLGNLKAGDILRGRCSEADGKEFSYYINHKVAKDGHKITQIVRKPKCFGLDKSEFRINCTIPSRDKYYLMFTNSDPYLGRKIRYIIKIIKFQG